MPEDYPWVQPKADKEVMAPVAANIPKRIADILRAEAKAKGSTISRVVAEALIAGRPDLPWAEKEGADAPTTPAEGEDRGG